MLVIWPKNWKVVISTYSSTVGARFPTYSVVMGCGASPLTASLISRPPWQSNKCLRIALEDKEEGEQKNQRSPPTQIRMLLIQFLAVASKEQSAKVLLSSCTSWVNTLTLPSCYKSKSRFAMLETRKAGLPFWLAPQQT